MFMLNIILALFGIVFFAFGFLISFKKKYFLANLVSFTKADDDSAYSEQIGLISLMSGMLYIFAGIVGFVSANLFVSLSLMVVCTIIMISFLTVSKTKAVRN